MSDEEGDDEPGAKRQCTCPPCLDTGETRAPVSRFVRYMHAAEWTQRERDAQAAVFGHHADDGGFDGGDGDGEGDEEGDEEEDEEEEPGEEEPENVDPEDIDNPDVFLDKVESFCRTVCDAVIMSKMPIKSCDTLLRGYRDSFGEYLPAWGVHMIPSSYRACEALVADAVPARTSVCSTCARVCSTCLAYVP
jgi:hypothetical protein